jgi:NAD(P) transhydrogenase subunit alpha
VRVVNCGATVNDADKTDTAPTLGVPKELVAGEHRVALVPDTVSKLTSSGLPVVVESGAGRESYYSDEEYETAGATIAPSAADLYTQSDVVVKVRAPQPEEISRLRPDSVLVGLLDPLRNPELAQALEHRGVIAFSMDAMPRITRAQSMDVLSSMSTLAGYKAVLLGANALGRIFPMLMTAAGTLAPARVLVLGAGVAGLQALATARRLGAVTQGFDTRPAVREQVQSVGATFIEMPLTEESEGEGGYAREMSDAFLQQERDVLRDPVARADVVITTAMVPGKRAPVLITEEMVQTMRPGSVIVDLASEAGGNCELTAPGDTVVANGVTIIGPLNLPSTLPAHASQMYSRNLAAFLGNIIRDGHLHLDFEDEITRTTCVSGKQPAQTK